VSFCTQPTTLLQGTGFEGAGATGWLFTTAPVGPNEVITIRFVLQDTGDGALSSTTLIDNWQWISGSSPAVSTAHL
jgi:hypothetical protein